MAQTPALPRAVSGRTPLEVARQAARDAGRIALDQFRKPQQVIVKGRGNLVTPTDLEIEAFLRDAFAREFPEHGLLSEETASTTATDGWVWVVDPLDGTRNYVNGLPLFCVNIALCYDAEPVVALTYDPLHDEAFWAERGRGAWLNDRPIRAAAPPSVTASILGVDLGYDDARAKAALHLAHRIFPEMQSVRIPGSAALGLAYAACGRYDLFVHHYLFPWDLAPGILLVREADGVITGRRGGEASISSQVVIAGSREAHADFLRWLAEHGTELDDLVEA